MVSGISVAVDSLTANSSEQSSVPDNEKTP